MPARAGRPIVTTAMQATTPGINAAYLREKFARALPWDPYLATDERKAAPWRAVYQRVHLAPQQKELVEGFTRQVNLLCVSGIWCGDCAQQGPLMERIAEASPRLDLRFIDRDEHPDLAAQVMINAGQRVPVVIFMAEDFEPVSILGDRTLSRYRAVAARQLGPSCPLPGAPVPADELHATLQEWLDEIERVHLLLRLSARLRQKHSD
jgi:thiol-disulfide isomerase/thioredoxin